MSQLIKKGMPRPAGCCLRFGAAPSPQAVPLWKQKRAQRHQAMFEAAKAGQRVNHAVFQIPAAAPTVIMPNPLIEASKGAFESRRLDSVPMFESGALNKPNLMPGGSRHHRNAQIASGMLFESLNGNAGKSLPQQRQERAQKHDAAEHRYMLMLEAVAERTEREQAAASLLDWAHGGGTPDSESFDSIALALMDASLFDGSDSTFKTTQRRETDGLTTDEVDEYNRWLQIVAETAVQMGANVDDVVSMIDADDNKAAQKVMDVISGIADEDQAIVKVATAALTDVWSADDAYASLMTESAMKKVVRRGQIMLKRKIPKIVYLSSAQRAALSKARLKAQTTSAKIMRAHSMKIRAIHGL